MTEIITYRLSSAGAWGYEFYDAGRNRIGSVSTDVLPSSPTLIKGEGSGAARRRTMFHFRR